MEGVPFLNEYETNGSIDEKDKGRDSFDSIKTFRLQRSLNISLFVNVALVILCGTLGACLFLITVSKTHFGTNSDVNVLPEPYSPANPSIQHEYALFSGNDSKFVGPPTTVWEESMHELLDGTLLRISKQELDLLGESSVAYRDGGYAATLGVAHNIHCVKRIKQFILREHFYPDLESGPSFEEVRYHTDHCLDYLRQSLMCHADYTVYTLEWDGDFETPTHRSPGLQKCVNWERLQSWMQSRAASSDNFLGPDEDI